MKLLLTLLGLCLCSCQTLRYEKLTVDVSEQTLIASSNSSRKIFRVSTGRNGIGNRSGSKRTPLGKFSITQVIGRGMSTETKFRGRVPVRRHSPIVSRIVRLRGLEHRNRNTFRRYIYIHGTPYEGKLGRPVSMGCVRMSKRDIAYLCDRIDNSTRVIIRP